MTCLRPTFLKLLDLSGSISGSSMSRFSAVLDLLPLPNTWAHMARISGRKLPISACDVNSFFQVLVCAFYFNTVLSQSICRCTIRFFFRKLEPKGLNTPKFGPNWLSSSGEDFKRFFWRIFSHAAILVGEYGCRIQFWKGPLKDHPRHVCPNWPSGFRENNWNMKSLKTENFELLGQVS